MITTKHPLALLALPALLLFACAKPHDSAAPADSETAAPVVSPISSIRIEAEREDLVQFSTRSGFSPTSDAERALLSGGDWMSYGGQDPFEVRYTFTTTQSETDDALQLWVRAFRGGWQYKIDDGEWAVPMGKGYNAHIVAREASRYFTARWQLLENAPDLQAGEHTLYLRRDPNHSDDAYFAIDCFELRSADAPMPSTWWSEVDAPEIPADWMAFEPGSLDDAPVQLGPLNPKPAGRFGRIIRDGSRLKFEKTGEPVRLWGTTASTRDLFDLREIDMQRLARLLSARGVNCVRIHGAPYMEETVGAKTDGIHRFVAALKAEGIYTMIDWVCTATDSVSADWDLPGFKGGESVQHLLHFSEPFREHFRARGRNLLSSENPYTGIPLAHDPAVAAVMLIDEDSPFFWTFNPERMVPELRTEIEGKWADWAAEKYGDLPAALAAWGPTSEPQRVGLKGTDAPNEGRLALYGAAHLGGQEWMINQRNQARARDQVRFMSETTAGTYRDLKAWLREELGYTGIVLASNWKTSDERVLGPLEYQLYAETDATARNTYFSPEFKKKKFHPWMPGDTFRSRSILFAPYEAQLTHPQLEAFPHFMTEGGYEMPNRYRTEEPLLTAAYYALQGIDAYFPFQLESDWNLDMKKWPYMTPVTFGQSPAAAYIYRAYIKEAPVVYRDNTSLADLEALEGGTIDVSAGLDDVQGQHAPDAAKDLARASATFDPLAFYVGRVTRAPDAEALKSNSLPTHIDHSARTVRSVTDQLQLDWGKGTCTIEAPAAQAAIGFFESIETTDAIFTQQVPYGAIALVSLDERPLAEASSILLQVMTEEQSLGFTTEPVEDAQPAKHSHGPQTTERILANGRAPIILKKAAGSVQFKFKDSAQLRITALDHAGRPKQAVELNNDATLTLLPDVIYYRIERAE